jgi:sterol desaturase/sphingolipid hydroxylase (fatty acid hydroxylase superfamily)
MDLQNWFGLQRGKYVGEPPAYVDTSKAPGMTEVPKPTLTKWFKASPFVLITSPNFIWALLSLLIYFAAPYKLSLGSTAAIAPLSLGFFQERLPLWLTVTLGYSGFWHGILYFFPSASRPFIAQRKYNTDKVIHNIFWMSSGIVIWTGFENIVCFLWATGRLPYIENAISFGTVNGFLRFLAATMGVPLWRSIHFYFAHRLLHFGPLYQEVHSLHHRNTDVEPFSGLCMHPVEHLYYYSCIAPSLLFYCSPFAFLWNGMHLLLSPAASHSGYEDHFQSDVFHYMHHRYFECNYAGTDAAFMDIFFGTFRGSFSENAADKDGPKERADAKSTLRTVPTTEFLTYLFGSALFFVAWAAYAINGISVNQTQALALSSGVGFGPILLAVGVSKLFGSGVTVSPTKMSTFGNLYHIATGTLFCSVPATYASYLCLNTAQ